MTTELDICNRALQQVGTRNTVTALDEGSPEADNFNLLYASVRDQLLSMAFWNFARQTIVLELHKQVNGNPFSDGFSDGFGIGEPSTGWNPLWPAPPWIYEYFYPEDAIQVRYIVPQFLANVSPPIFASQEGWPLPNFQNPAKFVIATDKNTDTDRFNCILTNAPSALAVYTVRNETIDTWSESFKQALITAIAGFLAVALTGDKKLAMMLINQANSIIIQARVSDGNEGMTIQEIVPDWIAIRDAGGGYSWDGVFAPTPAYIAPYNPLFTIS